MYLEIRYRYLEGNCGPRLYPIEQYWKTAKWFVERLKVEVTINYSSLRTNKQKGGNDGLLADRCRLKGPLRVFRLCLLAVLLPGLLIAVPLYLRYRVYSEHVVPLGMSDMRLVDNKISTTWCQVS